MFPLILVTICDQILKTRQQNSNSKLAAAAILKSTIPVDPPSQKMNFLFVIFNQKFNLYWDILTFKGSLRPGSPILKQFVCKKSTVQTFTGQNLAVLWTVDPS